MLRTAQLLHKYNTGWMYTCDGCAYGSADRSPIRLPCRTGKAFPLVSETHKSSDFIAFLKMLDQKYPEGDKIRLVLDNHSAHTSKETKTFLATMPGRFEFVFTPKHGSWLNMIEGFFGKMTHQMLRGIRVESKEELAERIYKYFDEVNKVPVVHRWKYRMDEIDPNEEVQIGLAI